MNLNEIRKSVETTTREVEFKPVGEPTGWFFELRHESSPEVQELVRRFQAKVRDLTFKRKTQQQQALIEKHEDDLRVAHVAGWRWVEGEDPENGRPPFSKQELRALLDDRRVSYHLKEFIDQEVGSLEDFLSKPEYS